MHLAIKIHVNFNVHFNFNVHNVDYGYECCFGFCFFKSILKLLTEGVVLSVVLVKRLAEEWQKSRTMKKDLKEQLVPILQIILEEN